MSGTSYLRLNRRWTSADVAAATVRLEKAFAKDKTARALAAMHKANQARDTNLLPVERSEAQVLPLARDRTPRKSRAKALPEGWDNSVFGGFSFRLPWAPSVNGCYFNLAKKGRARTTRAKEFEAAAMAAMTEQNVPRLRLCHPLAIQVTQYASSARGDIDNGLKIVLDCLKKFGVIADDNREIVKRITVEDGARTDSPWVNVTIMAVI